MNRQQLFRTALTLMVGFALAGGCGADPLPGDGLAGRDAADPRRDNVVFPDAGSCIGCQADAGVDDRPNDSGPTDIGRDAAVSKDSDQDAAVSDSAPAAHDAAVTQPEPSCGPDTCTGCCSEAGQCVQVPSDTACGSEGASCTRCDEDHHCDGDRGACAPNAPGDNTYRVTIVSAEIGEKDCDVLGGCDPYAIVHLGSKKCETRRKENEDSPSWEYSCFDASDAELDANPVVVRVLDDDDLSRHDEIGTCTLRPTRAQRAQKEWDTGPCHRYLLNIRLRFTAL